MITIKLETLVNTKDALETIAQKDLSIGTAYKVAKLIKLINAELEMFNEQRVKLLQDVGSTLSEDGTQYNIPMNKRQEFAEKFTELVSVSVDLPIDKIDLSNEKISVSPDLLIGLEPFIDFTEV